MYNIELLLAMVGEVQSDIRFGILLSHPPKKEDTNNKLFFAQILGAMVDLKYYNLNFYM